VPRPDRSDAPYDGASDAPLDRPLDLLAIAPHRDDAELTCGGTLARAVDAGHRVGILDLTQGEMGTRGSAALRAAEAAAAARVLGLEVRENLGLPDAGITNSDATRVRLVHVLRRLRPRVVIAPAPRGRHPDHRMASELVRDACFLSGLARYAAGHREGAGVEGTIDGDAPPLRPFRPFKLLYAMTFREDAVKPTFVVDITDQFARKLEAIRCFASQFDGAIQAGEVYPNGEPLLDVVMHQAAHYGTLIRARYGEPFLTEETMAVDDVVALGVSTF
jgi:bacillithiol biosynthesis deacetylase BshB1